MFIYIYIFLFQRVLAKFSIKEVTINTTTTKEEPAVFHDAEKN